MNRFSRSLAAYARVTDRGALPRRSRRAWGRLVGLGLGLAAIVLVGIVLVGIGVKRQPEALPTEPAPLHLVQGHPQRLAPAVAALGAGTGTWTDQGDGLAIAWLIGELELEVTPGQGVDLRVQTEEAEIRVVGTHFVVDRGPLGTRVTVSRGAVALGCLGEASRVLQAGESGLCTPNRAPGLLRRARALERAGEPELALSEVDRALTDPSRTAVLQDELLALRVALLAELGRDAEGLAAARAYLGLPNPAREHDILTIAADLSPDPETRCSFLTRLDPERARAAGCANNSGTAEGGPGTGTAEGDL